jgi:hypothetical protein
MWREDDDKFNFDQYLTDKNITDFTELFEHMMNKNLEVEKIEFHYWCISEHTPFVIRYTRENNIEIFTVDKDYYIGNIVDEKNESGFEYNDDASYESFNQDAYLEDLDNYTEFSDSLIKIN